MKDDKEIYLPDTTVKYKVLKDKLKELYGLELVEQKELKMEKKLCDVGTEVQTLIFSKENFTEKSAKDWAKNHDFKYGYVDEKENTYRIRQQEPSDFENMKTIEMTEGVKAVIGCPIDKYYDGGGVKNEVFDIKNVIDKTNFSQGLKDMLINDFTNSGYENVESLFAQTPEKLPLNQKIWATSKNIQQKIDGFSSGKNTYLQANKIAEIMYSIENIPKESVPEMPMPEMPEQKGGSDRYENFFITKRLDNSFNKDLNEYYEKYKLKLKDEDVNKLLDAGYTYKEIFIIYFGYLAAFNLESDREFEYSGLLSVSPDYKEEYINILINNKKNGYYEMGLKYPHSTNDLIDAFFDKYNVSENPIIIKSDNGDFYFYKGNDIYLGREINKYSIVPKDKYSIINGGYLGIVSKSSDILFDTVDMLFNNSKSYIKDLDIFYNGLGGVDAEDILDNISVLEQKEVKDISDRVMSYLADLLGESLKGGKADKLTLDEIALKHNVSIDYIKEQFEKGLKVESEHTSDKEMQIEIVKDHLTEFANYYIALEKMETQLKNETENSTDDYDGFYLDIDDSNYSLVFLHCLSKGIKCLELPSKNKGIKRMGLANERDYDILSNYLSSLSSNTPVRNKIPKNLNQLKNFLKVGDKLKIESHYFRPQEVGKIREISKVQTNGIWFVNENNPSSPIWLEYPSIDLLEFRDNGFSIYIKDRPNTKMVQYEYIFD